MRKCGGLLLFSTLVVLLSTQRSYTLYYFHLNFLSRYFEKQFSPSAATHTYDESSKLVMVSSICTSHFHSKGLGKILMAYIKVESSQDLTQYWVTSWARWVESRLDPYLLSTILYCNTIYSQFSMKVGFFVPNGPFMKL